MTTSKRPRASATLEVPMDSLASFMERKPTRRRKASVKKLASVTRLRPPIWIRQITTVWPNRVKPW